MCDILLESRAVFIPNRQMALETAKAGLRKAGRDILYGSRGIAGVMGFVANCSSDGLCLPETDNTPVWLDLEAANDSGCVAKILTKP